MIKRTLYFGNPYYLSVKQKQLNIKYVDDGDLPPDDIRTLSKTIPIEDIGVVVLDNRQITITSNALNALLENNSSVIVCDEKSMPNGLLLPLCGNHVQNERFSHQISASLPLKKRLWQKTISAKISNQASVLEHATGRDHPNMRKWANEVRSGDTENMEARAAVYYWKTLFPDVENFTRGRFDDCPNNLLNYGYAILRSIIARALVSSGMLPTLGIHHHNKYNAYCLADDIMEPYRPFVDRYVVDICNELDSYTISLSKDIKAMLLKIPTLDVVINGDRSPLMIAASTTTASLYRCFKDNTSDIIYPTMQV